MLNSLRQHLKEQSWPKWILVVVALSMTLYLGSYFFGNGASGSRDGGAWAARVDGETIPLDRFMAVARRIDESYRQLLGQNYSQFRNQFQIGTQAIRQLVDQQLILRDARRLGLTVRDQELIDRIRGMPELADANGRFMGKQEYERRLSRFYPGGVAAFERDLARDILIEKWTDLVGQPVSVDDAELEALYRERTEKTALRYVVVRAADQGVDEKVDAEELRRWYDEHSTDYEREAGRRIRYVVVERQPEMDEVRISEEEIAAAYQSEQARFSHPEQRRARHILFRFGPDTDEEQKQKLRERAEGVLERLRSGEDFATLARELSEDKLSAQRGGDLGWFGRGQMAPPFEAAVFDTPPGELAPVTETQFGLHVIEVTGARPAGVTPLDEVRGEIERDLRLARAEERMLAEARRIRAEITSPAELDTVAAEEGLPVESRFVSPEEGMQQIGASSEFRTNVMEMEPGVVSQPLRVARGVALVVVDELVPRSVAPFDEVEQRVRTELLQARAREAALAEARAALEGQPSMERIAKKLGRELQDSGDLGPAQPVPGAGGSTPEVRRRLFGDGVAVGDRGVVEVPAGALVYEVTRREPFDPASFAAQRADLLAEVTEQRKAEIRAAMVERLDREAEVSINEQEVARIDGAG